MFGNPTPILRIFDEAKAKEFYIDYLGFKLGFEHRFEPGFPIYFEVSRGDCVLHLSEHSGDGSPGARLRILANVTALQQEFLGKNYKYARPEIVDQPWGERNMRVADPFGNALIFFERGNE